MLTVLLTVLLTILIADNEASPQVLVKRNSIDSADMSRCWQEKFQPCFAVTDAAQCERTVKPKCEEINQMINACAMDKSKCRNVDEMLAAITLTGGNGSDRAATESMRGNGQKSNSKKRRCKIKKRRCKKKTTSGSGSKSGDSNGNSNNNGTRTNEESASTRLIDGIVVDSDPIRPPYCVDYDGDPLKFQFKERTDFNIIDVPGLQQNKQGVMKVLGNSGLDKKIQRLVVAMLMVETNSMALKERDANKSGGAENFSLLNLNVDMMQRLLGEKTEKSNDFEFGLKVLTTAIGRWGIDCTLNFVRGGSDTFGDRTSHSPETFRNAVATGYKMIEKDESFMTDGRRIQMDVKHV